MYNSASLLFGCTVDHTNHNTLPSRESARMHAPTPKNTRFLQDVSIALLCKPCISYDRDVRLSHASTESKRRKLGSRNLRRWIAQGLFNRPIFYSCSRLGYSRLDLVQNCSGRRTCMVFLLPNQQHESTEEFQTSSSRVSSYLNFYSMKSFVTKFTS